MLTDKRKIIISTGNILNVNKKAGQKTHEEVSQLHIFHFFIMILERFTQCMASSSCYIFPNQIPFMHH